MSSVLQNLPITAEPVIAAAPSENKTRSCDTKLMWKSRKRPGLQILKYQDKSWRAEGKSRNKTVHSQHFDFKFVAFFFLQRFHFNANKLRQNLRLFDNHHRNICTSSDICWFVHVLAKFAA